MKKIMQHSTWTTFAVALFLTFSQATVAQTAADDVEIRPLFQSHDTLIVRIEAPLTTLMREQPDEEYLDATFSYSDAAGQEHKLDLKLQTRGRFRRNKSTCIFSPLRLNFRKQQVTGTEFAGQDKLKLVTHCQRSKNYEQLLLITKYGFVIEDEDDIGDRIGLAPSKLRRIKASELDGKQANLVSVYEYLIGNTDFSLILGPEGSDCCHNAVLFSNGSAPHTPIPYDFDFSGLVDAPYAAANPRFKLRTVKNRLYRGRCINNEYLDGTFAYFLEKEPEFRRLLAELEGLNKGNRKEIDKFLNGFYKDITNPKLKQRNFITKCS